MYRRWVVPALVFVVVFAGITPTVGVASKDRVAGDRPGSNPAVAAQTADNGTGAGARVAGALAVQGARIEGPALTARLEAELDRAESDEQRARVAGQVLADALDRLDGLRAGETGSDGEMRTPSPRERAVASDLHLLALRIDEVAADLPADRAGEHGLTDDRIRRGTRALAGPAGPFGPSFYRNLSLMVVRYNERGDAPGFVATRLTGEQVTLRVEAENGSTAVSFAVDDDGRLRDVRVGTRDDATLRMTTDRATMREITAAADPQAALLEAIDRGDVALRGLGALNRVRWFVYGFLMNAADAVRGTVLA